MINVMENTVMDKRQKLRFISRAVLELILLNIMRSSYTKRKDQFILTEGKNTSSDRCMHYLSWIKEFPDREGC